MQSSSRASTFGLSHGALALVLTASASVSFVWACRQTRVETPKVNTDSRPDSASSAVVQEKSLRLYYLVDLDGYLEPCGCNSRPLGGIDRLAQYLQSESAANPNALFVATGDLFFQEPSIDTRMAYQEAAKADALTRILDTLSLHAYAPGPADYARGASEFTRMTSAIRGNALVANVTNATPAQQWLMRDVNGVKVCVIGVSDFRPHEDEPAPAGAPATLDPVATVRDLVPKARAQGARVVVVLASVPRSQARAIAAEVTGVDFVVAAREAMTTPPPPEKVGNAYVLTAATQGKAVGVVDIHLGTDSAAIRDASDATQTAARTRLDARIAELKDKIAQWEHDATVDRAAVDQQRRRLTQLEQQRAELDRASGTSAKENFFTARQVEISPDVTRRADVQQTIATYFSAVNEHNRETYKDLRAPPAPPGTASYSGNESCRDCHEDAYQVWIRTPHSTAYHTLEVVSKQYNLSCVGCHVTGYQRPGGSEVVQNDGLRDVGCESCHGPGSLHIAAKSPAQRRATIARSVDGSFCASQCHTMEHSDHFDFATYRPRILGPGHGQPTGSDAGVQLTAPILFGTDAATPAHDMNAAH